MIIIMCVGCEFNVSILKKTTKIQNDFWSVTHRNTKISNRQKSTEIIHILNEFLFLAIKKIAKL